MDHVAILRKANIKKDDNLLRDILNGIKTIESRWYVNKTAPWNQIFAGDVIYFKEAGCPVTAKATVTSVIQYAYLDDVIKEEIVTKYGKHIAPNTSKHAWDLWLNAQKKKKYCILIFLSSVEKIVPFDIDKRGYGVSSAWLCVGDINTVKIIGKKIRGGKSVDKSF